MENIDMNARCETSEDYLAAKDQAEEFEPYQTYKPTALQPAHGLTNIVRMFPHLNLAHPVDGDALAREEATELSEKLQKIAGFPLLPWQETYLNAAYDAAGKGITASVKLLPTRKS